MHTNLGNATTPKADQGGDFVITRRLIFLYCILWVFEGALRKWVVPSLSMQLLLVRDPVVLAIYYFAARARVFPSSGWLTFLWITSALIIVQGVVHVLLGNVSWAVAIFGLRCYVLHFPLIWVVPAVFGRKEIVTLGKWTLYIALPMALLMVAQFKVGGDHWLNAATLKGGGQISAGTFGKVRPPGLFSFIQGPIHYFPLCVALSIGGFLSKGVFPRWLAIVGLAASLIAMSVSASRGLVLGCAGVGGFGAFAAFRSGRAMVAAMVFGIIIVGLFAGISRSDTIQEGVAVFMNRWSEGDDTHGTGGKAMSNRYRGGFTSAFAWGGRAPLLGEGVGSGTNLAGSQASTVEIGVEGEWERVIYEIGPFTGFLYLGWRAALAGWIMALGLSALRAGNYVCLLLGSACFLDILSGFSKQPTSLGYIAMCTGLTIASARAFSPETAPEWTPEPQAEVPSIARTKVRGRGPFAVGGNPERL